MAILNQERIFRQQVLHRGHISYPRFMYRENALNNLSASSRLCCEVITYRYPPVSSHRTLPACLRSYRSNRPGTRAAPAVPRPEAADDAAGADGSCPGGRRRRAETETAAGYLVRREGDSKSSAAHHQLPRGRSTCACAGQGMQP
jgi:hypothetical protein